MEKTQPAQTEDGVLALVNGEIREEFSLHGGHVEAVSFEPSTGRLAVRLAGSCAGCPSSSLHLYSSLVTRLTDAVPAVKEIDIVE